MKTQVKQPKTTILMLIIIIAKLIGMMRDIVLANYYGTSSISDAYLIAVSVPTLLFYFVGHSLSTAYIPMYNKVKHRDGEKAACKYTSSLLFISLLICTVLIGLLMIWPNIAVRIFASGFDHDTAELAARFIRICAAGIFLMTLTNVYGGYLQANNMFYPPAAVGIPRSIAIIISIVVSSFLSIDLLGWGLLIAYGAELLLLLPFVFKAGYRPQPNIQVKNDDMKETLYIIVPIIIGMCVGQINKIIDKTMASRVGIGSVSALSYASVINNAVQEIMVTGIITILFANCAKLVAEGRHEEVKAKLSGTLNTMVFLLVPASCGVIVLAKPIVKVILARGKFDTNSLSLTVGALCCYTLGLTFLAVRDTLVKVFYAYKDTRATTITSIISIAINIILNLILSQIWGINGLALATSISAIFNSVLLFVILKNKIGDFGIKSILTTILKTTFACIIMVTALMALKSVALVNVKSELLQLLICTVSGVAIYFFTCILINNTPGFDLTKIAHRKK